MPSDRAEFLTPEEVATRLKVSPRDVRKAIENGELPGIRIAGQWRIPSAHLAAAASTTQANASAGLSPETPPLPSGLGDLLPTEHIIGDLSATSGPGVIYEMAAFAYRLGLVTSETWFAGALAEREAMMSTAVEGGLAFLHARRTSAGYVIRPFVLLGRSPAGVDFGAPDGEPTRLFFTLGLKYDRLHLRWLSRLAHILRSPTVVSALIRAPDAAAMCSILVGHDNSTPG